MGNKVWREQLQEAIAQVRNDADGSNDFDRGMQSGASMVAVRLAEIQRRDAEMKRDGFKRGSP